MGYIYDEEGDLYICPAGEQMKPTSKGVKRSRRTDWKFFLYSTRACGVCPQRAQCTRSKTGRKIKRWVHQAVIERLKERIEENPHILRQRKALVEHPFGTIKVAMNHERLLLKGMKNVSTEIKLTVLGYNFKRVISILGLKTMIEMLRLPKTSANLKMKFYLC